jgi:aspartate 1-decarboxylase
MRRYQVHVVYVSNGARFDTYAMRGAEGSGDVVINGAAARLVQPQDLVIIFSYGTFDEAELDAVQPAFVFVDQNNRIQPLAARRTA